MKHILYPLLALCMVFSAHAMRVEVHGNAVYATGPVEDDFGKFQEALARPGIDQVVFVNSPGGDLWTGMQVGKLIADKGLHTVIAGTCVSACSIMFMGGRNRSFSDAFRPALTYIGIHGAHNKATKAVALELQAQIYAFYKLRMGDRFNASLINQALYDMDDAGALLRVFDAQSTPKRVPFHCKSAQSLRNSCTEFKDLDAVSLGIVSTPVLTRLELPASYRLVPKILGQELTRALPDSGAYFQNLSAKQCTTDPCRKLIADYQAGKENKALALPVVAPATASRPASFGPGLGVATNRDTAINAFAAAIFGCNHTRGQATRLCETQTANGFDITDLYISGDASHVQALANLGEPADKFYGNEEFGGAMTSANGLRTRNTHDITPQTLDGIKTVGTQELVRALKSAQPPVVVDVWAGVNDAIPSAVTLLFGGLAFDDATGDSVYEARFAGLLKLLSPDLARPVVFYCQSRDCWLSVNAAMRAKKLGYSQVGWYRGGMESWKAANLPVASVVVRAVVR